MKKIILTIVMMAVALTALRAQYTTRISTDTMPCGVRQPNYYYSAWYDTTEWYLYGSALDSIHVYNDGRDTFYYHWSPYHVGVAAVNNSHESPAGVRHGCRQLPKTMANQVVEYLELSAPSNNFYPYTSITINDSPASNSSYRQFFMNNPICTTP